MVVAALTAADIVTDTADDDVVLTDEFRAAWRGEIDRLQALDRASYLASFFEADRETMRVEENPDGSVTVRADRDHLGEWPSETAIDADVACFLTLQEWFPEWDELTGGERDSLVAQLRLFLEACPACEADLTMEESAMTPEGVPRVRCADCDTTLV